MSTPTTAPAGTLPPYDDAWLQRRSRKEPASDAPVSDRLRYWWDELSDYLLIKHGPALPCRAGRCRIALCRIAAMLVEARLAERVASLSNPLGISGRDTAIMLLQRLGEMQQHNPEYMLVDDRLNELRDRVIDGRTEADHVARMALADELRRRVLDMPAEAPEPDPLARRAALRALAPKLEALADAYSKRGEPLRAALNDMLAADAAGWPEALFAVGPLVAGLDLSDAAWGYADPLSAHASDEVLARYSLLQLLRAAAAKDRDRFDTARKALAGDPAVAAEANNLRRGFASDLMGKARCRDRAATLERAQAALATEGLDLSTRSREALDTARCLLSPHAAAALRHWIDPDATPCWLNDGRIPPLGTPPVVPDSVATTVPPVPETNDTGEGVESLAANHASSDAAAKQKRSAVPGEARVKLISALTAHHKYDNGSCLNPDPIGSNRLATIAGVAGSSASAFFQREFRGYENYRALCSDTQRLVTAIKLLNNEYAPHLLYGSTPAEDVG